MSAPVAEADVHAAAHERFQAARPDNEVRWIGDYRRAGMARFKAAGFPTPKVEEYRFTSVAPIARTPFRLAADGDAGAVPDESLRTLAFGRTFEGHQIVFVNGRHAPALSSVRPQDGVEVGSLRELVTNRPHVAQPWFTRDENGGPFGALNAAFVEDGPVVVVGGGVRLEQPLHLVMLSTRNAGEEPIVSHPRVLVALGHGAEATIVESYGGIGDGAYWTNAVTDVVLGESAVLDHTRVQRESETAYHVGLLRVRQGRSSSYTSTTLSLGAALARLDVVQVFEGEGGESTLNGLFMADGSRHTDTHTLIDHAVPRCSSRQLYKGIVDDRARGVFHGKVRVRQDAQKTDAWQVNKNLLLSGSALVHSTPALEIYADDVKCKHGSTTGQLDPLQLFYLRSRGISEEQARNILTYAFASDVVSRLKIEALRHGLTEYLQSHLRGAAADLAEAVV